MESPNPKVIDRITLQNAPQLHLDGLHRDIGRTLVVAPHPDDESLGCGGLIHLLRSQNTEVQVVFVTNGGASHPNSITHNSQKLQALRQAEAKRACAILGIEEAKIHFIKLEDSKLHEIDQTEIKHFIDCLNSINADFTFDSLLTTWRRDAHSDHRATYVLCEKFIAQLDRPIQFIEFPIWLWENGQPDDWPTFDEVEPFRLNITSVMNVKEKAIQAHKSQTTRLIDDDPDGFILTNDLLAPFRENYEYFLFTISKDKATLDGNYFNKLYSQSDDPWDFQTSHYERQKYLKTLEFLKYYRFQNALELGCSIGEHSNLLSRHCDHLTSIDISSDAIQLAKNKYHNKNIDFKVWNVSEGLPEGQYDLITLCEVGYYLNKQDLEALFEDINHQLKKNGILLLVHWTSYVREYPLTGRQVHYIFENQKYVLEKYIKEVVFNHPNYQLILWKKLEP